MTTKDRKQVKLGDIASYVNRGISPKYAEDGVLVINQKCIRNGNVSFQESRFHDEKKNVANEKFLQKYDILINSTGVGTLGRVAQYKKVVDQKVTVDSHVSIVRVPKNDLTDPKFVGYVIKHLQPVIENMGKGATGQTELGKDDIKNLDIYLPPLPTQQRIAFILSTYDDLIENNTRRIKILEEQAQLIYKEWFMKFKFPGWEKVKMVDSGTELGKIPEGWSIGKIGDLYEVKSGFAFKSENFQNEGNPVIKIKNVGNNTIDINNVDCVDDSIAEQAKKFLLINGDILIAMTGATIGKIGLMPICHKKCYLNQRVGKFFPIVNYLKSNVYLYFLVQTKNVLEQIINIAQGAAQPNISGGQIENIKIIIPTKNVLIEYQNLCDSTFKEILSLQKQNQNLKETRDMLIPKLVSGEVEV